MTTTINIQKAATEFMIAYCCYTDNFYKLTSNERRSISLKAKYAEKRLEKVLGFDMGRLWELNDEQMKIREMVYSKVKELKNEK